jgi:hypothetical protein
MNELCLHSSNYDVIAKKLKEIAESGNKYRVTVKEWREKRTLSQNAFQHVIYEEVSKYLIRKGRTNWTPGYTKENLKNKFLGWEEKEFIDVVTGEVKSKEVLRSTATLDLSEAHVYTSLILNWAESIGCKIKIPENSEYFELEKKQNE